MFPLFFCLLPLPPQLFSPTQNLDRRTRQARFSIIQLVGQGMVNCRGYGSPEIIRAATVANLVMRNVFLCCCFAAAAMCALTDRRRRGAATSIRCLSRSSNYAR